MKKIEKFFLAFEAFVISFNLTNAQDTWTQKANFPGPERDFAFSFTIGNNGYFGGGIFDTSIKSIARKDFWKYNTDSNSWTQLSNLPGDSTIGSVGLTIGNKGWVFTGFYGHSVYEFDPSKYKWTQQPNFPGKGRSNASGFSIGSKAYIGLGMGLGNRFFNDFWEYDTSSESWTRLADFPGKPRGFAIAFSIGNKAYVGTGWDSGGESLRDFWEYNPASNKWTLKDSVGIMGRIGGIGFSMYGHGFIGLGENIVSSSYTQLNDLWRYDTSLNLWGQQNYYPGLPCVDSHTFQIGNQEFIVGGICAGYNPEKYSNEVWELYNHTSGIPEPTNPINFSIYPNPNTGHFILNSSYPIQSYEILDMNGKEIYRKYRDSGNGTVNIYLSLANGIYLIRVVSEQGTSVKKLIVNN